MIKTRITQICSNIRNINITNLYVNYTKDINYMKAFGKHLRKCRKLKGITQEQLSDLTSLAVSQIGRIERGEINTSISHIKLIADKLGLQPYDLFKFNYGK